MQNILHKQQFYHQSIYVYIYWIIECNDQKIFCTYHSSVSIFFTPFGEYFSWFCQLFKWTVTKLLPGAHFIQIQPSTLYWNHQYTFALIYEQITTEKFKVLTIFTHCMICMICCTWCKDFSSCMHLMQYSWIHQQSCIPVFIMVKSFNISHW